MTDVARRVAVVVGGGGGIGAAISKQLDREGFVILLVDRDRERLESVPLPNARRCSADITKDACVEEVCRQVELLGAEIDLLIHAAGLTQVSLAEQTTIEVYRRVMDVNFFAVVNLTRRLIPALAARQGQIVVLSSICGFAPLIARTGYCASKHALHGYFNTLRLELKPMGVGVLMVCPSFADTDFASRGLAGDGSVLAFQRSTLGKAMSPETIALAICRSIHRRRRLLVLSWRGKLSYWLTRLVPSLYDLLMSRSFEIERRRSRDNP